MSLDVILLLDVPLLLLLKRDILHAVYVLVLLHLVVRVAAEDVSKGFGVPPGSILQMLPVLFSVEGLGF